MDFAAAALSILDSIGQAVTFRREGLDDVALSAAISDYGLGPAPSNWPGEKFLGQARHAAFRLRPSDLPLVEGLRVRPQAGDVLVWEGLEFNLRACAPEPMTYGSAGPMWWVCMAKTDQRSRV